jgi:hypothetical protein
VNIFCGEANCYDIIGVPRTASFEEIRKSYRKLSIAHHPDKHSGSAAANATVNFQRISKAYEVLKGNESRPLFDYYLDHPWVRVFVCVQFIFCIYLIVFRRIIIKCLVVISCGTCQRVM